MRKVFEQLILDFHASDLPVPSRREIILPSFDHNIRKVYVFIGMRRSGKTWTMYQQMHSLLKRGVDRKQILYLNFEDDRLLSLQAKDFQSILDAYFELHPQYAHSRDVHFFFDEIHEVNGWEHFIRRLLDQEKMDIYISGSSSKMLGKEIASTLRGRTITKEVFPFSFREYLYFKNVAIGEKLTTKQQAKIAHHAKEFLQYGGFPEVASIGNQFLRELLQGYIDVVIYRDIIERYKVSNARMLRELIKYCLQNISSLVSMNKIYHRFKSEGKTVGKNSLYEFMVYLEDAYCIFTTPMYTLSTNKQNINPKKIYSVDQGFITAYTVKPEYEESSRLENAVFCQLRRKTEKVFYYKTKTGKEVDFLVILPDGSRELYQVCVSLFNERTSEREISAITQAMKELGIKKGTIVTIHERKTIKFGNSVVYCVPAWQWLLESA